MALASRRSVCGVLCALHLIALSLATYVAAIDIHSILITGCICSLTGIAAGIAAYKCGHFGLAAVGFLTFLIAITLFVLEALVLHLGPVGAALPFCVLFIFNQVVATVSILKGLSSLVAPDGKPKAQLSIRTLLVGMFGFCVFFAVARHLLQLQHDFLMAIALGLIGLTSVGLLMVASSATQKYGLLQKPKS